MRTRIEALSLLAALTALPLALGCPAAETADSGGVPNDEGADGNDDDGGDDGATFGGPADDDPGVSDTSAGQDEGMQEDEGAPGTDDGADSGGFIAPPDGGVTGQCDPAAQDCPEGEKCTSYVATPGGQTVDATKCVPDTGNAVAGEPCIRETDTDDCAAGFFCMTDVSGNTGDGFCLEYCDINTMECEFGGECFAFNDGALPVCEVTCDPLLQDCPPGQGCYSAFENFVCAMPGHPDGGGGDGSECATIQGCQPGLVCTSGTSDCPNGGACCSPLCEVSGGGAECTDAAEDCVAVLENPPPGLADVGACAVPE